MVPIYIKTKYFHKIEMHAINYQKQYALYIK